MRLLRLALLAIWLSAPDARAEFVCSEAGFNSGYQELTAQIENIWPASYSKRKARRVTPDQIDSLNKQLLLLEDCDNHTTYLNSISPSGKGSGESMYGSALKTARENINEISIGVVPMTLASLSKALRRQEKRLAEVQKEVERSGRSLSPEAAARLRPKVEVINEAGTNIWNHLKTTSLNVDRTVPPNAFLAKTPYGRSVVLETPPVQFADDINSLQARVADLLRNVQKVYEKLVPAPSMRSAEATMAEARARQERLRSKGLLGDPFASMSSGILSEAPAVSALGPRAPDFRNRLLPYKSGKKTLLDMRQVPAPSLAERPRVLFTGSGKKDAYPLETKKVERLRAEGKTRTIGDPVGRAKYIFKQTGSTCGIATQVLVLKEAGVVSLDPESSKKAENDLFERALKSGFFSGKAGDPKRRDNGGTPIEYIRKYAGYADSQALPGQQQGASGRRFQKQAHPHHGYDGQDLE